VSKVKEGSNKFSYPKIYVPLVDTNDIGICGAVCLTSADWSVHHGKYYEMNGPEYVNGDDIADCLSRLLEKQVKYNELPKDVYSTIMPKGVVQVMEYIAEMGKEAAPYTMDVKNLTGQNGSLEDFFKKHL